MSNNINNDIIFIQDPETDELVDLEEFIKNTKKKKAKKKKEKQNDDEPRND